MLLLCSSRDQHHELAEVLGPEHGESKARCCHYRDMGAGCWGDAHDVFDLDPVSGWTVWAPVARVADDPGWPLAVMRMSKGDSRGVELLTDPITVCFACQCTRFGDKVSSSASACQSRRTQAERRAGTSTVAHSAIYRACVHNSKQGSPCMTELGPPAPPCMTTQL